MTREIISLGDSNWRFGSVEQKPFGDLNDLDEVHGWLPAQVPGDVRLDLMRARKIADPFYAANNEDSQWVDARDWWYVRDLDLELQKDERAFLVFEGIDYQSAVFFNGRQLGRHVGMFSRQLYEIKAPEGRRHASRAETRVARFGARDSTLAIRIWGSDALPRLRLTPAQKIWARIIAPLYSPPFQPFPDRYATLKCQMQFGWDFAPRLRTCGIWDDACVIVARSVLIEDVWIKAQVKNQKEPVASVEVTLTLDSSREQSVRVMCAVGGKNFAADAQTYTFDLHLERGNQTRQVAFDLHEARLWNPWDRGEPNLYEMQTSVLGGAKSQDAVLDSHTTTFGIRSFELARTRGAPRRAEPWTFVVNGAREFVRGTNWVPLDAIPARLTREHYAARLKQARDANVNFLRVWGGGLKEKRAFYDVCDELGILVWQEFPFAGAILDRFPRDRAFLDLAREECGAIVRALRNHPSLVVWCGGNEFNPRGNRALVKTLRTVVKREDGTRPFKPASPYRDESHYWGVWHHFANLRDYRNDQTPFLSEFGLQGMPDTESLKNFLPSEALNAPHALWEYHHAQLKKLGRYARSVLTAHPAQASPGTPAPTVEDFVAATQRAQAFGLQVAIEHMRRRKVHTPGSASARGTRAPAPGGRSLRRNAAGVAVWQFNDAWPAISWSVVDYYGTAKRAYAELERLYSPVLASFDYALSPRRAGHTVKGNLWLINDLRTPFQNALLSAHLNGKEFYTRRVDIAPDCAERVDALAVTLGSGENMLRLKVTFGPTTLSDHEYDLNLCDVGEIHPFQALLATVGRRLMR